MSTTIAQINQIYAAIDYAPPPVLDAGTLARYQTLDPAAVVSAIETSPYTLNVVDPVIREYQAAFNRAPDPQGAGFWVHQLESGSLSFDQLSVAFANSQEFGALYNGAHATTSANAALVTALYTNVLARTPDAAGLAFWIGTGDNAVQLLQHFAQSTEAAAIMAHPIMGFQNAEAAGEISTGSSAFSLNGPVGIVGVQPAHPG
jgi:Domain of unknown function (DUF4214)